MPARARSLAPVLVCSRLLRPNEVEEGVLCACHEGEAFGRECVKVLLLAEQAYGTVIESHELTTEAAAVVLLVQDHVAYALCCGLGRKSKDTSRAAAGAPGASRRPIFADLHTESSFLWGVAEALPRS